MSLFKDCVLMQMQSPFGDFFKCVASFSLLSSHDSPMTQVSQSYSYQHTIELHPHPYSMYVIVPVTNPPLLETYSSEADTAMLPAAFVFPLLPQGIRRCGGWRGRLRTSHRTRRCRKTTAHDGHSGHFTTSVERFMPRSYSKELASRISQARRVPASWIPPPLVSGPTESRYVHSPSRSPFCRSPFTVHRSDRSTRTRSPADPLLAS